MNPEPDLLCARILDGTPTVEELRDRLEALGASDPEVAHGIEDHLHRFVLARIAAGGLSKARCVALALDTLTVTSGDWERWYS